MRDQILELPRGVDRDYQLQLNDPTTGLPLTSVYTGSETLSAIIWDGADGPAVATPTATWISGAAGTIKLTLAAANTATLDVQPWPIRVSIAASGRTFPAWEGWLDLQPSPGSGATLKTYGSFGDMVQYGGQWVKQLLTTANRAGFLEERARARSKLDEWILANYRPQIAYSTRLGSGPWQWSATDSPNQTIKGYLDADKLKVTDKVREIAARLALHFACEAKLDPADRASPWADQARYQWRRACSLAVTYVAEIDTNGDGYPEFTVNLGKINTRTL